MAAAGDPVGHAGGSVADTTHDLYRQYGRQIYAYCLHHLGSREEAEDAVQTTFLNAFRGLQRGTVARCEQAWLYKIAQNVCFARRASAGRRLRVEAPNDFEILQEIVPSKSTTESLELMGLDEALEKMPENQRRAILLREWQGLSYREISEELGLSQGAVEMLIFRARRSLATALEQPAADARKTGKARSGWSLGSLVAAMKSLFSGAAAVKMAAVAVSAAVVSTSTAHSVVHRFMRDISSAHRSAAVHPTAAAAVALASVTVSPALPRATHLAQLTPWQPARATHSASVVTTAPAGHASRLEPVLVQDEAAPTASDAAGTTTAATTSATATTGASSSAPARASAPATSAAAQTATASASAIGSGATTAPRGGRPTARTAPLPSSTATLPGSSSSSSSSAGSGSSAGAGSGGSRPGSAKQAPLPSSGATLPGGSTSQDGTSTSGDGSTGSSGKGSGGGKKDKHAHGHGGGGGDSSAGGSSGSSNPSGGSTTPAPDPAGDGSGDTSSSTSGSTDTTTTSTTDTTTTTTTTSSGSGGSDSSGSSGSGDSSGSSDSGSGNGHHHGGDGGGGGNGGGGNGGGGHHGGHGH